MRSLQGLVVLDLTHMLSGPYGTMLLADLGARTIKVEPTGAGEGTRALLASDPDYSMDGLGAYFLTLNRGKESVSLDLKSEAGYAVFLDLVRCADVVFDNFGAGVTQRLKIDYETLAAVNPRIVTCSVTGFGQTGPHMHRPAFDQVVQGAGGGMSITGLPDGPPVRAGIPIGDLGGGLFGAIGVLAALTARERTGRGQHVDVSMLDAQISLLNYMATMHLMSGVTPDRIGNAHFVHVPYNTFRTADGYIIIACIGDPFFALFRQVLPLPLLQDPAYAHQPARYRDRHDIDRAIEDELMTMPSNHWLELLRAARIPCGKVNDFQEALSEPQVLARNMVVEVTLPSGKTVRMPGNPVKLSEDKDTHFSAPPTLGQDTDAVLRDLLHYSDEKRQALREAGAMQ